MLLAQETMISKKLKEAAMMLDTSHYESSARECGRDVMAVVLQVMLHEHSTKKDVIKQLHDTGIAYNTIHKELEVDNADKPLAKKDITFLCSVYEHLWEKVNDKHQKLKYHILGITDEGNTVCSRDSLSTQHNLDMSLRRYEGNLKDVLKEAETLYPSHKEVFTVMANDVDRIFADIRRDVREAIKACQMKAQAILKGKKGRLRSKYRVGEHNNLPTDMNLRVQWHCKALLSDWLHRCNAIDPRKNSVSLEMDKADESECREESPSIIDQKEILQVKGQKGEEMNVVLISGRAGLGKTALLFDLAEKWVEEEMDDFTGLRDYTLLLCFDFRNRKFDNLDDYFKDAFQEVISDHDFPTVKSAILGSRCLFLCNDFSRSNENSTKLFEEILTLQSVEMKVIVTTRPIENQIFAEMLVKSKKTGITLTLSEMPEESVLESIKKLTAVLIDDKKERQETLEAITEVYHAMPPELKNMMRTPLYNRFIINLLSQYPKLRGSISTVTKLLLEVDKADIKRIVKLNKKENKEEELIQFRKLYNMISLQNYFEERHELEESDIKSFKEECQESGLPYQEVMSNYFKAEHSLKSSVPEEIYCHKHPMQMEFATASAISDMLVNDDAFYNSIHQKKDRNPILTFLSLAVPDINFTNKDTHKKLNKVLFFVTGLLCSLNKVSEHISDILRLFCVEKDTDNLVLDNLLPHLLESQNNTEVREVIAAKLQKKKVQSWLVKDKMYYPQLLDLLTAKRPKFLSLSISGNPATTPHLTTVLETAYSKKIAINLHIWNHYYGSSPGYSDNYIEYVKKATSFRGFPSAVGVQSLPQDIDYLFVRLDKHTLPAFHSRLPQFTKLKSVSIFVFYEDVEDDSDNIQRFEYTRDKLTIEIDFDDVYGGDSKAVLCAQKLNAMWPNARHPQEKQGQESALPPSTPPPGSWSRFIPRVLRQRLIGWNSCEKLESDDKSDGVIVWNSDFTKAGVEKFLQNLKIEPLEFVDIHETKGITKEEIKQFRRLYQSNALQELSID